jgi:6-hydroxycyclohex-1-ene-1-carbonyl-CoA dehydrogenase
MTKPYRWMMTALGAPLEKVDFDLPELKGDEVVVKVAGCGVCHTDIGFLHGGVRTNHELPLALGHEISGTVVGTEQPVIIPAVLPCGDCELCDAGHETACRKQLMPGNDFQGGFASHIVVPSKWLVDASGLPDDVQLADVSVLADAISTPYQACERAEVGVGDNVIVIGAGGVGSFGVQIAKAFGANVICVDIDDNKLERAKRFGAIATVNTKGLDADAARKAVQGACKENSFPRVGVKVLEMSGTPQGQELAWSLMTFAGVVGIVGFCLNKVEVRLSNLMAFDARAFGNWGCRPQLYKPALDLIRDSKVSVLPFIQRFAMNDINSVLDDVHAHKLSERPILIP